MQHILSLFLAALIAHPVEALVVLGAVVSLINGALPASVQRGPVGRVLHAIMDRSAVLTRSDARGTLKWPGVASELLDAGTSALRGVALPAAKQGALDVLATRESVAPPAPTPPEGIAHPAQVFAPRFDPATRQTIAPEVVAQIAGETLPR